jgi:hypothetical protein
MSAERKPRYRTPSICADVDVSLSEFSMNEIVEYLRHHGYTVSGGDAVVEPHEEGFINTDDLNHIFSLSVAGQFDSARQEALRLVSNAIGRPLL